MYDLTKSYFSQHITILSTNSIRLERDVSKRCPQGSCCGPGFWNLQYNSWLNLAFKARTKAVAFADDLILAIRGDSVSVAENYSNGELSKITAWSKSNKIRLTTKNLKICWYREGKEKSPKQ
jgi:hypothetical protein